MQTYWKKRQNDIFHRAKVMLFSPNTVQSLSLFQFSKGSFCYATAPSTTRLLPLRPWGKQYHLNFSNQYLLFSKMYWLLSTFCLTGLIWCFIPAHILLGSLIKMLNAFYHFTEILWLLGCWQKGKTKQVEGQSAQRDGSILSGKTAAIILHPMAHHADATLLIT